MKDMISRNNFRVINFIVLILITIFQIMTIFRYMLVYKGVYSVVCFGTLAFFQFGWICSWYRSNMQNKRLIKIYGAIIIGIFLLLIMRPMYTYEQGRQLAINKYNLSDVVEYVNISNHDTVRVHDEIGNILINSRYYYYVLEVNGDINYIALNPMDGKILKLENDFYSEY